MAEIKFERKHQKEPMKILLSILEKGEFFSYGDTTYIKAVGNERGNAFNLTYCRMDSIPESELVRPVTAKILWDWCYDDGV